MSRAIYPVMMLLIALLLPAVRAQTPSLMVVATTTQAADAVRIIAADLVDLTQLMGAGVDPHLYKPTESDITAMNQADLVIYSGLNLEGQFESVFQALGETRTRIFALGMPVRDQGFTIGGFDLSEKLTNVDDPHFWFDPRNWQLSVEALAALLAEMDPANAATYQQNAAAYNAQLTQLYDWGLAALQQIPAEQRVLVTSHDAFQYFADGFAFDVAAIQGLSTADEAGVGDVQQIVNLVVERRIPVMFIESSVPPNAIQSVQEAAAAQGWQVALGVRTLYSDAMGAADEYGGTYVGMIAQNIITILQSFGYPVPEFPAGLEPLPPADLLAMTGSYSQEQP